MYRKAQSKRRSTALQWWPAETSGIGELSWSCLLSPASPTRVSADLASRNRPRSYGWSAAFTQMKFCAKGATSHHAFELRVHPMRVYPNADRPAAASKGTSAAPLPLRRTRSGDEKKGIGGGDKQASQRQRNDGRHRRGPKCLLGIQRLRLLMVRPGLRRHPCDRPNGNHWRCEATSASEPRSQIQRIAGITRQRL